MISRIYWKYFPGSDADGRAIRRLLRRITGYGLSVGALVLLEGAAQAEVFRYVDRDGKVHEVKVADNSSTTPSVSFTPAPSSASTAPAISTNASTEDCPFSLYVHEAARLYSLPVELLVAVMKVESGFHPKAISRAGAMGLMQLTPATAEEMGVRDPFDPRQNILGGARKLRILANTYDGDMTLTLAAYSAGPGAVERYGGIPPFEETQKYVVLVIRLYRLYKQQGVPPASSAGLRGSIAKK